MVPRKERKVDLKSQTESSLSCGVRQEGNDNRDRLVQIEESDKLEWKGVGRQKPVAGGMKQKG